MISAPVNINFQVADDINECHTSELRTSSDHRVKVYEGNGSKQVVVAHCWLAKGEHGLHKSARYNKKQIMHKANVCHAHALTPRKLTVTSFRAY